MAQFSTAVYVLCFLTSSGCALLLGRSYMRTSARVLMWSALCFGLLAANNLIVVIDMLVLPNGDLRLMRHVFALAAGMVLIFGFIWDLEE